MTKCGFSAERVENGVKKLVAARGMVKQRRMDCFFKVCSARSL